MADLRVSLQLNAEDLLSPQVNRALRAVQQLQRGVQDLNGAGAGGRAGAGLNALGQQAQQAGQQAQQAGRQVGGLSDAIAQLLPNIAQVGLRAGPWVALAIGVAGVTARTRQLRLETEQARQTLSAFAESGQAVDEMMQDAQRNAMLTGKSLGEVQAAQASLASVGRTPAEMRQMVELAERLAVLAPEQGIQGAAFAIREASAGQFESAVDRMNISRATINALRAQGVQGTDVLTKALDQMGVTMEDVARQGEGLEGQTNRMTTAFDNLLKRATDPSWGALEQHMKNMNDQVTAGQGGQRTPVQVGTDAVADAGGWIVGNVVNALLGNIELVLGGIGLAIQGVQAVGGLRDRLLEQLRQGGFRGIFGGQFYLGMGEASSIAAAQMSPDTQAYLPQVARQHAFEQSRGFGEGASIAGAQQAYATYDYISQLEALEHTDDMFSRHRDGIKGLETAWTDSQVALGRYDAQLKQLGQERGVAGGLLGALQQARTLERRMGTYHGEYDADILGLKTRDYRLTLEEGAAAHQRVQAGLGSEAQGGSFYETQDVQTMHVDTLVVTNQDGGGQMSSISGSGLPARGPNAGRYDQARWTSGPWAPGIAGALR